MRVCFNCEECTLAMAIQFSATKASEEQTYESATFRLDQVPV